MFAFAAGARLPATYDQPNMARAGGLIAYGPLLAEHYVMAAGYVDRILKGAKPADLPVEQPTRFELVINLEDREGARPDDSAVAAAARGRGDPIVTRRDFMATLIRRMMLKRAAIVPALSRSFLGG